MKPWWGADDRSPFITSRMGTEFWRKHSLTEKGWVTEQKAVAEAGGERRAGKEAGKQPWCWTGNAVFLWGTKGLWVFFKVNLSLCQGNRTLMWSVAWLPFLVIRWLWIYFMGNLLRPSVARHSSSVQQQRFTKSRNDKELILYALLHSPEPSALP